jgi:hypothetical protein
MLIGTIGTAIAGDERPESEPAVWKNDNEHLAPNSPNIKKNLFNNPKHAGRVKGSEKLSFRVFKNNKNMIWFGLPILRRNQP